MDKLIVTVTCNSTMSYPSNPNNPTSRGLEAVAAEYVRGVNAGASICHLHGPYTVDEKIREDGTKLSDLDIPGWRRLRDGILAECDAIIQYGIANGRFQQRKALIEDQRPDMLSTCFNAHDECFDYEPGREPVELYAIHDREELREYCELTEKLGVKIEVEAFHYGGVWNAMRMRDKGLLKDPIWVTFFLGWKGGCWTPPTVQAMTYMADHRPEGFVWNTSVMDPDRAMEGAGDRHQPGRACARRHGGQPVHRTRRICPLQCRSRRQDRADRPRSRTRGCQSRRNACRAEDRETGGGLKTVQTIAVHNREKMSMKSNGGFTIDRRTLLGTAAMGVASLGSSLILPSRAGAATTVQFQTSAGARFGTPNTVLIKDFNKENPDTQIVMDTVPVQNYFPKLSTEVASNSPALDFFTGITNLLYAFAATGKIVPFDEVMSAEEIADLEKDIPAHYLDTWRYKGKLYAVPNDSNAQWSFYRKDLFDGAGAAPADQMGGCRSGREIADQEWGVWLYRKPEARRICRCPFQQRAVLLRRRLLGQGFHTDHQQRGGQKGNRHHAGVNELCRSGLDQCRRGRHGTGHCKRCCRLGAAGVGSVGPDRREAHGHGGQYRDGGAARRWRSPGGAVPWRAGLHDRQLEPRRRPRLPNTSPMRRAPR